MSDHTMMLGWRTMDKFPSSDQLIGKSILIYGHTKGRKPTDAKVYFDAVWISPNGNLIYLDEFKLPIEPLKFLIIPDPKL